MAPLPFSQAWRERQRSEVKSLGSSRRYSITTSVFSLITAQLMLDLHLPPCLLLLSSSYLQYAWEKMTGASLTSWYFSRAMLVSAASGVSMKISLFLWIFSRIPCKQKTKTQNYWVKLLVIYKEMRRKQDFVTLTCSYQDATMFSM